MFLLFGSKIAFEKKLSDPAECLSSFYNKYKFSLDKPFLLIYKVHQTNIEVRL